MSAILAVDWGQRRLGLAVSDPSRTLARPLPTLHVSGHREAVRDVSAVARKESVTNVLLGLPLKGGAEGDSARQARKLGDALCARGFQVSYRDESHTSEEAARLLAERGEAPEPGRLDQLAALILLQEHLDAGGTPGA